MFEVLVEITDNITFGLIPKEGLFSDSSVVGAMKGIMDKFLL